MRRRKSVLLLVALLTALTACDRLGDRARPDGARNTLLIAPHIQGTEYCPAAAADPTIADTDRAAALCARVHSNAAGRISAALDAVGPRQSPSGRFTLGYTLSLPLMRYARPAGAGWTVDQAELQNDLSLVRDIDRPVVLYLSLNHFTDAGAEAAAQLAKAPDNLMWTRSGPLGGAGYFGLPVHAWTLADEQAPITLLRRQLFKTAVEAICRLDDKARSRIAAISLLGEVHQLFPQFADGPGYLFGFDVTDYSPASVAGFRRWLASRFGSVAALNRAVGGRFASFDAVVPPSRDVLATGGETLAHEDTSAAGTLNVYGWAYDPSGRPLRLALYIDGRKTAEALADLNRPDVPEALSEVRTPNVGFHFGVDYRGLRPGAHTLELAALRFGRAPVRFGGRRFHVLSGGDAVREAPVAIPVGSPDPRGLRLTLDGPAAEQRLLFNPLAELWLEYRNAQVRSYYESFAEQAAACLPRGKLFSHQITPQLNTNWNSDLLAVDASQRPDAHYLPGATLYGGAAFGDAFFRFKDQLGWTTYGVSEMHPTFPLSVSEMETMLDRHRRAGARFVAPYYMYVVPQRIAPPMNTLSAWRMTPDNADRRYGGASFYRAIQDLMRRG